MTAQPVASTFSTSAPCAPTPGTMHYNHSNNLTFENEPSVPNHIGDRTMIDTNGITRRTFRGRNAPTARPATPEFRNWFTDKLAHLSTKEIAALGECTEDTAENIKLGRSAPKGDVMTAMFRNSPELGGMYMEYIGILLPGQAEMAAAYTRFANAAVRGK